MSTTVSGSKFRRPEGTNFVSQLCWRFWPTSHHRKHKLGRDNLRTQLILWQRGCSLSTRLCEGPFMTEENGAFKAVRGSRGVSLGVPTSPRRELAVCRLALLFRFVIRKQVPVFGDDWLTHGARAPFFFFNLSHTWRLIYISLRESHAGTLTCRPFQQLCQLVLTNYIARRKEDQLLFLERWHSSCLLLFLNFIYLFKRHSRVTAFSCSWRRNVQCKYRLCLSPLLSCAV